MLRETRLDSRRVDSRDVRLLYITKKSKGQATWRPPGVDYQFISSVSIRNVRLARAAKDEVLALMISRDMFFVISSS